jgi:hypothetical protein
VGLAGAAMSIIYDDFDEPGGILRVYHWHGGALEVHLRFPRAVAQ